MIIASAPSALSPWLAVVMPLVGTFVGAALAFGANYYFQYRQRRQANKAAGNMALAILSKQYGDFIIFRAGLGQELAEKHAWPEWLQIRPTVFKLSETLRFDIPTLVFLLEHKRPDILSKLFIAETKYHDLRNLIEKNGDACELRDANLVKAGFSNFELTDLHRLENCVNHALQAKLYNFNLFLQQRARDDARAYRDAAMALTKIMQTISKSSEVMPFTAMGAIDGLENQDWPTP